MFVVNNTNNKSKNNEFIERKRKLNVFQCEPVAECKKKKFSEDLKMKHCKYDEYKATDKYIKIVAKPQFLKVVPKIFEKAEKKKNLNVETCKYFILDFLNLNCFNSDLKSRFQIEKKNYYWCQDLKEISGTPKLKDNKVKNAAVKEEKKMKLKKEVSKKTLKNYKLLAENEIDTENLNQVDVYKIPKKNSLIFHMHHPCSFSFQGEIKINVISGEVEVLGFTLGWNSQNNSIEMYSPNLCTPLIVESKPSLINRSMEEIKNNLRNFLSENEFDQLTSKFKSNDCILLIEQVVSDFGIVINKYFDQPLFSKDLEDISSSTESSKTLQSIFNFKLTEFTKEFKKNSQWDKITLGQCTVLCGGKGVGKSTLLKYYLNKVVCQGEKALCLDFDIGQPEFTAPGFVSAVVVDKPLLGPNFTHVTDPELSVFYGDINVSHSPARYLECVNYVINFCKKNPDLLKIKWFVNTMGFSKGLGVDLMVTILKLLNPNTVVQIKSIDFKKNYPFYLTPNSVNSLKEFSSMTLDKNPVSFDLHIYNSCAEREGKSLQGGLKPRQLRDLMTISYFSKMVSPPYYSFNAVKPYLIPFSELYLGIDFLISPNDILKSFNANTVSLSCFEPSSEEIYETDDSSFFKIVIKPNITASLGLGFIRGIDCSEKKIYVITHLSTERLSKVNCLSLGRICLLHSMFLNQDTVEIQPVYTSVSTADTIQRVKRTFRTPGPSV